MLDNKVYKNQLATITVISSITFKFCMLPRYIATVASQDSWLAMVVMMSIEIIMYGVVYYVISKMNLASEKNKWLMIPIMLAIYIISMLKAVVLFNEVTDYNMSTLFDKGNFLFIILAILPIIGYVVHKGGNIIARLSQIVFYVVIAMLVFRLFFTTVKINWTNLLPIMSDGGAGLLKGCDSHFIWFGDYIPLLFFNLMKENQTKFSKFILPTTLIFCFGIVVLFYMIFIGIYGESAMFVNFAFNRIGIYNRLTQVIGPTNFPSIITWSFMSIIHLTYILYACSMALTYFIKKFQLAIIINCVVIGAVIMFELQNFDQSYILATSSIRYLSAIVQYSVPVILGLYAWRKYGKTDKA